MARNLLVIAAFCLHACLGNAAEAPPPADPLQPIPFKTEPTPVEEQGSRAALVFIGLLLATGIGLYIVRKRMPRLVGLKTRDDRLRVLERSRLSPRCTLYLIQLDHSELLVAQCGDHLLQLDLNQAIPPTGSPLEIQNA